MKLLMLLDALWEVLIKGEHVTNAQLNVCFGSKADIWGPIPDPGFRSA